MKSVVVDFYLDLSFYSLIFKSFFDMCLHTRLYTGTCNRCFFTCTSVVGSFKVNVSIRVDIDTYILGQLYLAKKEKVTHYTKMDVMYKSHIIRTNDNQNITFTSAVA